MIATCRACGEATEDWALHRQQQWCKNCIRKDHETMATKKKTGRGRTTPNGTLDVPVKFKGVSHGKGTSNLGLDIERAAVTLKNMEHLFCGSQLEVRIVPDDDGQEFIDGLEPSPLAALVECKSFSAKPDGFSSSLSFNRKSLGRKGQGELDSFAHTRARLIATRVGDAAKDVPGQMALAGDA